MFTDTSRYRPPRTAQRRAVALVLLALLGGCTATDRHAAAPGNLRGSWTTLPVREVPPPEAPWRPCLPSACRASDPEPLPPRVRRALDEAEELLGYGEGGDAIVVLELALQAEKNPPATLLIDLAQLYVLAGQGEPSLVPREGPAADTGSWPENRRRFLARARRLLRRALEARPDDAAIVYLLADAARAAGRQAAADSLWQEALQRCPYRSSMAILSRRQELSVHPPRQGEGVSPVYPPAAAREGVTGEVDLDLLVAPDGTVRQVDIVASPDGRLSRAAAAAFRGARCEPGRIGKYPVWSWLRAGVVFR